MPKTEGEASVGKGEETVEKDAATVGKGEATVEKTEAKFSKDQLLKSVRYQHRRDLLETLLDAEKSYSHAEVEEITNQFMKERVK